MASFASRKRGATVAARRAEHALPHLAIPDLHAGRAAGVFRAAQDAPWIPWLLVASYFFYGWWNPYYLLLVVYSTVAGLPLVALMDHCPRRNARGQVAAACPVLDVGAFVISVSLADVAHGSVRWSGPTTLRPTLLAFAAARSAHGRRGAACAAAASGCSSACLTTSHSCSSSNTPASWSRISTTFSPALGTSIQLPDPVDV